MRGLERCIRRPWLRNWRYYLDRRVGDGGNLDFVGLRVKRSHFCQFLGETPRDVVALPRSALAQPYPPSYNGLLRGSLDLHDSLFRGREARNESG